MKSLSSTSLLIIDLLKQNSRLSVSELSDATGVSRTTVSYHIRRLVEQGYIKRFTIDTSPDVDNYPSGIRAMFDIKLRRNVCGIIFSFIADWKEVVSVWSTSGSTDMRVLIEATSQARIEELRDRLARHPELQTLTTSIILKTWCERSSKIRETEPEGYIITRRQLEVL